MTQQMGRVVGAVLTLLAVVVAVVALAPAAPSAAQPLPPNRFFGTAPANAAIVAMIGSANVVPLRPMLPEITAWMSSVPVSAPAVARTGRR